MERMSLVLDTHEVQLIVIALIEAQANKMHREQGWSETYKQLADVFGDMNCMCRKEYDYKLKMEVTHYREQRRKQHGI